jgi:hypothetical protein
MAGYFSPTPRTRKRIRKLEISEISGVDKPAQDPARSVILKRVEAVVAEARARLDANKGLDTPMSNNELSKKEIEEAYTQALKDWSARKGLTAAQGAIGFYETPQARALMKSLKEVEAKRASFSKRAADASVAAASLESIAHIDRLPGESLAKSWDRLLQSEDGKALYSDYRKSQHQARFPGAIEKWERHVDRETLANPNLTRAECARNLSKRLVSLFAQARLSGLPDID